LILPVISHNLLQSDCKKSFLRWSMCRTVAALIILGLLVGCSQTPAAVELPELSTLSTAEVAELAKSVTQPVIVEFSVLHGCDRCARMRPQVRQLASEQAAQVSIKRADFITNQPLLQSLGATVCPSYVLFAPGSLPQLHTSPQLLISLADSAPVAISP
jgi:thiol-disulfide isomerase/thioredoxin